MIAARNKSLMDQLRDLFKRVGGEYWPVRMNLHLPDELQKALPDRLRENFNDFAGHRVAKTDRTDGLKLIFDDGSWILMRPSGTEPVARIYTEASTEAAADKLAEDAKAWITK
jgi:phosphoglucomutase